MPDLWEMGSSKRRYVDRGKRIELAMEAAGLDQTELAEVLGITQPTVCEFLQGGTPARKHLKVLAKLLDVDLKWITTGHPEPPWLRSQQMSELSRLAEEVRRRDARIERLEAELRHLRSRVGEAPEAPDERGSP